MSEGLILLTNRGELVNRLLRSEFDVEKEYLVELSHAIADDQISRLARGVEISDDKGRTRPCKIERIGPATLRMILTEGRNRQIRRMAEVVQNHVRRLERQRVMHIRIGTLPRGQWRHLSIEELSELFQTVGMDEPLGGLRPPDTRPHLPSTAVVRVERAPGAPGAPRSAGPPSAPPQRHPAARKKRPQRRRR
jgi:pseudouridine synthase